MATSTLAPRAESSSELEACQPVALEVWTLICQPVRDNSDQPEVAGTTRANTSHDRVSCSQFSGLGCATEASETSDASKKSGFVLSAVPAHGMSKILHTKRA